MDEQSLSDLVSLPNPLSTIVSNSRKLAQYYPMFSNPQQIKYYSQFPQIQSSLTNLETQISDLVKDIGNFIGCELGNKSQIKLGTTVEIVDQYADNIQIKIKKFQEEEQKIRIKQKHPEKSGKDVKPQKKWNLKRPERVEVLKEFSLEGVNHQSSITPSGDIKAPLKYIETEEQFRALLLALSQQKEIAVDLEHSDKSYTGFTCLIQISTRTQDYIVDVFPLWNQIPHLNQIFNNPDILKVLHGAYMDVKWLHRDFDIKITNLFDTFHASQHLKNQQNSYAYLLKHYCNQDTNKKYQMADWRERPLSDEMKTYARIDTHYLLEIYDRMKADIIEQAINNKMDGRQALNSVFANSRDVTQTYYSEGDYRETRAYVEMMERQRVSYPEKRCKMLEKLFELRDGFAREEDENPEKLIPGKYLFELADKKEFIYSEILKMFRKNPQLKEYASRICQQMNQYIKVLGIEGENVQEKGIVAQKEVPVVAEEVRVVDIGREKRMQVEEEYEDYYFELETPTTCTFKQFQVKTLQSKQTKPVLMFECPLSYELKRFQGA